MSISCACLRAFRLNRSRPLKSTRVRWTKWPAPTRACWPPRRALRSLKIPDLVAANLQLKQRQRGCSDGQYIESIVLLQTVGGDCPEDLSLIAGDDCLERGLGFALPKTGAVRAFLNRFHDPELELGSSRAGSAEELHPARAASRSRACSPSWPGACDAPPSSTPSKVRLCGLRP